jgi:hypothetical protein
MNADTTIKRPALRYYGGKWNLAPWIAVRRRAASLAPAAAGDALECQDRQIEERWE